MNLHRTHGASGRLWYVLLVSALILAFCACEKKKVDPVEQPEPSTRVAPTRLEGSQIVLRKTFAVTNAATFPFEIPAHAASPHLHGLFASFIRGAHVGSDEAANVDFLILNAEQFDDFVAKRPSETLFSVEASHNQSVNVDLPASFDEPKKYYLIFRKAAHSTSAPTVEANFRVDF